MRIKKIERLIVKYHEQIVGTLSLTPDNKQCAFEYDKAWLSNGFSISPLELPLKRDCSSQSPHLFMEISAFSKTVCPTAMVATSCIRPCSKKASTIPIVSARPSKPSGKWGYGSTHIRTGNHHRHFA